MNGPTKNIWATSLSNKWGFLFQGNIYCVKITDTIEFIHRSKVLHDKKVAYDPFILDV